MSRSGVVKGGFNPRVGYYVENSKLIRKQLESRKRFQQVLESDRFEPRKRMRYSLVLTDGNRLMESMLWVARVLLLFCLNTAADSGGAENVFIQYMERTLTLDEPGKELAYGFLR